MIKIGTLYTLYGRRAGAELYCEKIITGMIDAFSDISFLVYCNKEAYDTLSEHARITKKIIPFLSNQFLKAFWLEFIAAKNINKQNIDCFWIPSGTNSFPGPWKAKNYITFLDLGEYFIGSKYDFKRMVYRKHICIPRSLKRANGVTTISQTTARDLKNLFPELSLEPKTIYLGPSPRNTSNAINDPEHIITSETGIDLKKIILVPGRTDYIGKGLDTVMAAYQQFSADQANAPPLIFIGSQGEGHDQMLLAIRNLGLTEKAKYLGRVSDKCVDALYAIAEMVILASRYEGFGFPILEAWQHHVPIICSDGGSIPEIAGDAALHFHAGDVNALAEAMQKIHAGKTYGRELIEKGIARLSQFSWEKCYNEMRSAFLGIHDSDNNHR